MPLNPKFNEYLKQDFDHLYSLGPDKLREIYKQMVQEGKIKEEVGNVEDRIVKTTLRDTLIRIYRPKTEGTLPVVFWMHGGGFVLGDIEHGDFVCRRITNNTNCAVISIEYSLCPPYKFPEPENECYEIIKWAYENAEELKIDPSRICLAGDSAGASLAAGLCYRFRNEKTVPICYQVLVYGCFDWDDAGHRKSRIDNGDGYRLTTYGQAWHKNHHFKNLGDAQNPLASALFIEDFKGLPPALIITSEYDPLRDESIDLATYFSRAGVEVCIKNYLGIIHGFLGMRQLGLQEIDDAIYLMSTRIMEAFNNHLDN